MKCYWDSVDVIGDSCKELSSRPRVCIRTRPSNRMSVNLQCLTHDVENFSSCIFIAQHQGWAEYNLLTKDAIFWIQMLWQQDTLCCWTQNQCFQAVVIGGLDLYSKIFLSQLRGPLVEKHWPARTRGVIFQSHWVKKIPYRPGRRPCCTEHSLFAMFSSRSSTRVRQEKWPSWRN